MKTTIGIPAFNEEKNIGAIITKLKKISDSIIVCDDGSTDLTAEISKGLGAIVVSHSKNQGYGDAIKSIFLEAKKIDTDVLVTFDADGQHSVEDAKIFAYEILKSESDIIFGSRFLEHSENIPFLKKTVLTLASKITNLFSKMELTDTHNGMKAIKKDSLAKINIEIDGYAFESELIQCVSKKNLKYSELPTNIVYTEYSKAKGQSLMNGFIILEDLIKLWLKR
mgnify:CR=1 FL=1